MLLRIFQTDIFGLTYQALPSGTPMAASDHPDKLSPFLNNQMQLGNYDSAFVMLEQVMT